MELTKKNKTIINLVEKTKCSGCKMCGDICPQEAITFAEDEEGFWDPQINAEQCISCGKCLDYCPVQNNNSEKNMPIESYAAWNKDDTVRRKSTSGGLYHVFASHILSMNGYLVGCVYSDDYKSAYHTYTDSEKGLQKLMGSKYFQSDTGGIFAKTKDLLATGKPVLFVGTPCQVAALQSYMGNTPDNLYTIDFICRGVTSPMLQKKKIEYYEELGHSKVTSYKDKHKKYAWIDFGAQICYENGKEKFVSRWKDQILHCFIQKDLSMRKSCYSCQFKLGNMKSDLTIGDFWGIDRVTEKDLRDGVSALIVNTNKGQLLVNTLRDKLYLGKRPLERVYKCNPMFIKAPEMPPEREDFFRVVNDQGLGAALKKYKSFRSETKKQIKYHEKRMKIRPYLQLRNDWKDIKWKDFIYYNYICKSVIREKNAYLIPYKGAAIEIHPDAKLYLKANACINYTPFYPRGNQTAVFQLRDGSETYVDNRLELGYGSTLSVAANAQLRMGYFMPRANSNIICKKKMTIGNAVLGGRNACIFDSDFHPLMDENFKQINPDKELQIEDNVWYGSNVTLLKGSYVGHGSVIGSGSIVTGKIEPETLYVDKRVHDDKRKVHYWEW